jgi:maltooligosyltrehalose synthase
MNNVINPVCTYRIQFHKDFNFSQFAKVIPYLRDLGVKTIYASPIFEATPGSTHGYDGTDPNKINPEIGTIEQLYNISSTLQQAKMYWLQDIVPNHLAYHQQNKWLMDVLKNGRSSEFAPFFDIIWDHPDYHGRLMVPFPGSELEKFLTDEIPGEKNYVLCSWQETDHRMNYRRFFLVNTLICTNIHDDKVFQKYHELIKELVSRNIFQGLRVDHIDGLYDPAKYLLDLRNLAGDKAYIIVEKILEPGETMPTNWPAQGNSGYDFLGMVNNLFTNRKAEYELTTFYYDLTKEPAPVEQQIRDKKSMILHNYMAGELSNLVRLHRSISKVSTEQLSDAHLRKHIADYLIDCPVYRYYDEIPMMDIDKERDALTIRPFYQRCMQFTGPLMAKGVEDTLMYTYNRFIGHNEVGDSPEFFGYSPSEFHELMKYRQQHWPLAMNATSTHDTKRGEDVRARLNVLTDFYEEWTQLVKTWLGGEGNFHNNETPDANDRYFIYQTLAGSFPWSPDSTTEEDRKVYPQRLKEYLEKSMREAKVHSTWTEPDTEYESATINFANSLLDVQQPFFRTFEPFLRKVVDYGMVNSFAQLVMKFTCPGIPDVYQGTELWDLSLVDPDNRRPVDYKLRERLLNLNEDWMELWQHRWDGSIKFKLLKQLLKARSEYNEVFVSGEYIPLEIKGSYAGNVFAFMRRSPEGSVLAAVPLNYAHVKAYGRQGEDLLRADWKDTCLELAPNGSTWTDLINGETKSFSSELNVSELFQNFVVAVYASTPAQ